MFARKAFSRVLFDELLSKLNVCASKCMGQNYKIFVKRQKKQQII